MGTGSALKECMSSSKKSITHVCKTFFIMEEKTTNWLKSKGYLHITPQIDILKHHDSILRKVKNKKIISQYAFFPLIHAIIKERKYKRIEKNSKKRTHSYVDENGKNKRTIKNRPLHYATHMDAVIFGYYTELLQEKYEALLKKNIGLSDCVIAYRKIPIEGKDSNKSTIHFASEIFEEIRRRSNEKSECAVLAFDIQSFFPTLDHQLLKQDWANLLEADKLPDDHYNIFKAATRFSYIMKDELRHNNKSSGRKPGFNEKELATIRNNFGINSFFESTKVFRERLKSGELKLYKYPFRNEKKEPVGIPQGLPISALLANLYLYEFDLKVLNFLVNNLGCYYRRYSDDIAIVCNIEQKELVEEFIKDSIKEKKLKISDPKTEKFHFRKIQIGKKEPRLTCTIPINQEKYKLGSFIYLGFEFNGQNSLIKSSNLSKFYRRMISSVKRKAKRAIKIAERTPGAKPVIFRRQLYKLYTEQDLTKIKIHVRRKKLIKTDLGKFKLISEEKSKLLKSNYLSYVKRASEIMNEPKIVNQIRNHSKIFNSAIHKHLNKK